MSEIARQVLEAKLALEAELVHPLYLVCRQYITAWQFREGRLPTIERMTHVTRIEQVLRRHYARAVMVMTGRRPSSNARIEEAALSIRHLESLAARARNQALLIVAGIDRDLRRAADVGMPISDDGTENFAKSSHSIAESGHGTGLEVKEDHPRVGYIIRVTRFAREALARLKRRAPAIANVQIQPVSEEARHIQAEQAAQAAQASQVQVVPDAHATGRVMQRWRNMQDERVRHPPGSTFDHVEPHGQTVPVAEPFTVSGELLRFPGDSSLGASLGNLVNCRCQATFLLVRPDGTETEIFTTPSAPARRTRRPNDRVGLGERMPANPTSAVTLNGRTNARVVLSDGSTATLRQVTPNTLRVSVRGRTIARAHIENGKLGHVSVAENHTTLGIRELLERSVEHSFARMR